MSTMVATAAYNPSPNTRKHASRSSLFRFRSRRGDGNDGRQQRHQKETSFKSSISMGACLPPSLSYAKTNPISVHPFLSLAEKEAPVFIYHRTSTDRHARQPSHGIRSHLHHRAHGQVSESTVVLVDSNFDAPTPSTSWA